MKIHDGRVRTVSVTLQMKQDRYGFDTVKYERCPRNVQIVKSLLLNKRVLIFSIIIIWTPTFMSVWSACGRMLRTAVNEYFLSKQVNNNPTSVNKRT